MNCPVLNGSVLVDSRSFRVWLKRLGEIWTRNFLSEFDPR